MSPLRSFNAHVAIPQRKASFPTWTRPAPNPASPSLPRGPQDARENATRLRDS